MTIPQMYDYDEVAGLENFIKNTLRSFSTTKALIIDIRNNPGGSRAILQTLAGYIVQAEQLTKNHVAIDYCHSYF